MGIDLHAHLWSERYLDLLAQSGKTGVEVGRVPAADVGEPAMSARLALMDSAGVQRQVLSVTPQSPHLADETAAVAAARFANDLYAEVTGRRPDRFSAFAALPLPHVDAALAELARAMDELGMAGAAITTDILGRSAADPLFEPLFAELDRRHATLFIHPAGRGVESPLINDFGLTWLIGAPIEDTVSVLHLIRAGVPVRYPNVRIVNAHLGGALPMVIQRLDNKYGRDLPDLAELPSVTARRMWYDTVSHNHPPALRAAAESLGADRLVLGTDFPYLDQDYYRAAVSYVRDSGLRADAAAHILEHAPARVLGLKD